MYFPNMRLEGTFHTSFSQSKVKIHFPPLLTSLNFLTCGVQEKQRNEVTDWGRQFKNTLCKFLPSAWFTYHSGPGKRTRGFISNPAQVQSDCWEVAEVFNGIKRLSQRVFWPCKKFWEFWEWIGTVANVQNRNFRKFFFFSLDLSYTFLFESPVSPFTDFVTSTCSEEN